MSDAANISSNYVDLVSLSARQVFGSLGITVSHDTPSTNESEVKVFMKDIGSSGCVTLFVL